MHKKGGQYSTRLNGERISYDITLAVDKKDEDRLLKAGWNFLLVDACKSKPKAKSKAKATK